MARGSVLPFEGKKPVLPESVFLATGAVVAGDITCGEHVNIWFNAVLRGDVNFIRIGARTNIQDNVVCHVVTNKFPLLIGEDVTVGHGAILHGCTVGDKSLIGMGAKVLDGAVVEAGAFVAAGAVVSPGKIVKSGTLWAGVPAQEMRELTQAEKDYLDWSAPHYVKLAQKYMAEAV